MKGMPDSAGRPGDRMVRDGSAAKLDVDQRQQLLRSRDIALLDLREDQRDFAHNCHFTSGEVKMALKLTIPIRVTLDRIYTSRFMIQGTIYWNMSDDPSQGNGKLGAYNPTGFDEQLGDHAVDVMITRSRFRPHQNAWPARRLGP